MQQQHRSLDAQDAAVPAPIRPLKGSDLWQVAALYQRAFRHTAAPPSDELRRTFAELFLLGPFAHPERPSLVYADPDGRVRGFIGALTRPFDFKGRRLRGVAATELMVDDGARGVGMLAYHLLSALLSGPQDFVFSDGSRRTVGALWLRSGGEGMTYYSLEWTRVLRPAQYLATRYGSAPRYASGLALAAPVMRVADQVLVRLAQGRFVPRPGKLEEREASVAVYQACLELPGRQALRPVYDERSLEWLLAHAHANRRLGPLRLRVLEQAGRVVGGYCHYVRRGGMSHVLHLGAASSGVAISVVDHLLRDAWQAGAVAVSGQADERFQNALDRSGAVFRFGLFDFLAHSRDPELLAALQRGDTALTRLDGEWWTRLGVDRLLDW
jgi:hypothetical protein